MSHVNEGLIHAWLDGQLPPDESAQVEQLVATDAAWGAAAAEARGLIAGASRILGALDDIPAVQERAARDVHTPATSRRPIWKAGWIRAAAGIVLVAGIGGVVWLQLPGVPQGSETHKEVRDVVSEPAPRPAPVTPAISPPPAPAPAPAPQPAAGAAPTALVEKRAERDALSAMRAASRAESRTDAPRQALGRVAAAGAGGAAGAANEVAAASAAGEALKDLTDLSQRVAGCWRQVDSSATAGDRDLVVLFFSMSAAPGAALQPPVARSQAAAPSAKAFAAATSATVLATPRRLTDSTFQVEWTGARGRTRLAFTVRGDTLRGTTRMVAAGQTPGENAFVAVRSAACPR